MEKVIMDGKELDVNVELKEGKVKLSVAYDGAQADAGAFIVISVDDLLDKLAAKIPGVWDDVAINLVKQALKAI